MILESYVSGNWQKGKSGAKPLFNAVNGEKIADISSEGIDFKAMLNYARTVGGPKLRKMTFHERARMLKALAQYLMDRKDEFYKLSAVTGATKIDSWIDIEGGIGTLYSYASKGRRELPDEPIHVEGKPEVLSKNGTFVGRHICVPLEGVAVHINAFNFPCWGMLEKLSPTILAGVPAIIKPASLTAYLAELMVRRIIESKILPEGALQIVCGSLGDTLKHITCQDAVTFTGSAETGRALKGDRHIVENSIRFNLEADSLNCSILAPDCAPGTDEFALFVKEVSREMTVKAGQKCTAIRRAIVPDKYVQDVIKALSAELTKIKIGDPAVEGVKMGPLAGTAQVSEVSARVAELKKENEVVFGSFDSFETVGADRKKGAFCPSMLLFCKDPLKKLAAHNIEAFGPISTVMPYKSLDQAIELAKLGKGSLVGSLFTADDTTAREVALGVAAYHGRLVVINRDCAKESTGHGSPLPTLVHGGPGRAGGGEEMGGMRAVMHYMQRTAIQGSPTTLSRLTNEWSKGATQPIHKIHPFRKHFDELEIGETLVTHRRTVTEADIVNFAGISGDTFYAHVDDIAAKESIFGKRVAHGYFVLAAAAGLFVDPAPGPVLANYGLENLRFVKPVYIGDTIQVKLTCKRKTAKDKREGEVLQGVVEWDVEVINQEKEAVAIYTILTLVKRLQ